MRSEMITKTVVLENGRQVELRSVSVSEMLDVVGRIHGEAWPLDALISTYAEMISVRPKNPPFDWRAQQSRLPRAGKQRKSQWSRRFA